MVLFIQFIKEKGVLTECTNYAAASHGQDEKLSSLQIVDTAEA